ncbi:MAG: GGDEF domain-containing protein [Methylomonas sp.]|nr:GGDEF domain-containing protein [Methylomonas sp.]PPD21917.1 MAG: GGDEF domain-containing protein [Methylomonas sp.]PPD25114.1 MAG: GGDEF domain-containing protein [Methylomonas sp.]PPD34609.1 MAG: GGDEF domain-containing protein [Methylomonas sp.]PPD40615.1 MAG: GGDEF domain-containing protein [Methylomonas sp.]
MDLQHELASVLAEKRLTPIFQPVISVNQKKIIGYEALIRGPSDSPLHSPLNLFDVAERYDMHVRLEFVARELTIHQFSALQLPGKLFLNVSPSVLLEPDFKRGETLRFIEESILQASAVIIELTEHQPTHDYEVMRDAVKHYRDMGFEIALDDLGAGYSGLRLWSELRPEYVKIDKHFIQGVSDDPIKFNFVRSIQSMASAMHCKVIAEGIETLSDLQAVAQIGISHAQGFYLARPLANPPVEIDAALLQTQHVFGTNTVDANGSKRVAELTTKVSPVPAQTKVRDVLEMFQRQKDLNCLPILEDSYPCGLIFREKFFSDLFSSRYGIELHGKQPIARFIDSVPLCFDKTMPLEQVSQQLTASMRSDLAFIVTDQEHYYGIGTVLHLLAEITQQQIHYAKHANPLTLLPGSVPINESINQLLAQNQVFAVAYFDLDNFKPYNDCYGYSAGDNVIKAVADILVDIIPKELGRVGHIGGDDFIAILTTADYLPLCEAVLNAFERQTLGFYSADDWASGGIHSEDRQGNKQFFGLLSLSCGLVDPDRTACCTSHVDIADLTSEAKKQAKKLAGNSYFINRRMPTRKSSPGCCDDAEAAQAS